MTPTGGFFAGLGCGLTILVAMALRPVSPRWLRILLVALMLVQAVSYMWNPLRLLAATGLLVASIFSIDQLIRHPAMSPRQLLRWCGPLLMVSMVASALFRWAPSAVPARVGIMLPAIGSAGFILWALIVLLNIPSPAMRQAVGFLAAGHALLAGEILAGSRALLAHADVAVLLALWYAYDLAYRLETNR